MDYQKQFEDDILTLFASRVKEDDGFAHQFWSAFGSVHWYQESDPNKFNEDYSCYLSGRHVATLITEMQGKGEYTDWFLASPDNVVSDFIAEAMASRGWCFVLSDDPTLKPEDFEPLTDEQKQRLLQRIKEWGEM